MDIGQEKITGRIIAVKENIHTGAKLIMVADNLITSDGDAYYATMACGETPSNDFDNSTAGIKLGIGTTGGGEKDDTDVNTAATATGVRWAWGGYMDLYATGAPPSTSYPKTNDTEANNSGQSTDVVTWYYYWATSDGTCTGIIINGKCCECGKSA